jgi:hypothetical protein
MKTTLAFAALGVAAIALFYAVSLEGATAPEAAAPSTAPVAPVAPEVESAVPMTAPVFSPAGSEEYMMVEEVSPEELKETPPEHRIFSRAGPTLKMKKVRKPAPGMK